jgi:pyrroline-5-carboxylate reductase
MAGVPIARIKNVFSNGRIIRTMPNLPLQVGEGLVGWSTNKRQFSEAELRLVEEIFSAFGQSIYVNNEKKLDAITAVSASGPAYVFLFIDALVKAAEKLGFDKKQSETLVLKTITGSVSYLQAQDKKDLEQLIKKVASKGGITEVALKELKIDNFYKQWQKAIAKAHQRARQLSSYEPK